MRNQIYGALAVALSCFVGAAQAQKQVLVTNKSSNTMSILDPVSLKTIATVPTGEAPHELIISQSRQLAIVGNYGHGKPGHTLSIIDLKQHREIKRVNLGPIRRPHRLAIHGDKVYFSAEYSRLVARYDLAADSLDWINGTGQSGSHMVVVHPDGKTVYTANRLSNTVSKISVDLPDSAKHISHITAGPTPEGIDISADGRELWVGSNVDGKITILDAGSMQKLAVLSAGKTSIRVKFSPDGHYVVVTDPAQHEVYLFDAGKKSLITKKSISGAPMGVTISGDSQFAFVALSESDEVVKLRLPDLTIEARGKVGRNPDGIGCVE
ncbi:MAG TPA: beta-propeller fold lactonase family protein [Flavihumibacter sp.]